MKIVVSDNMEKEVVEELKTFGEVIYLPEKLEEVIGDADVLIVRSQTKVRKNIIEKAKKLKIVARAGIGLDNIDVEECEKRGIKVINTPEASTISVAELTICLMLVLLRNIVKAHTQMKNRIWKREALIGKELYGKTLGIIGFGRIGRAVAERAKALGMDVLAVDPYQRNSPYAKLVEMDEALRESDILTFHVPLTDNTRKMINKEAIDKMKKGVFIINTSRGEIIDEDALYDALKNGKIAGAGLDVLTDEPYHGKLLELENVVFSSHIGANTRDAQLKVGKELIRKLKEML